LYYLLLNIIEHDVAFNIIKCKSCLNVVLVRKPDIIVVYTSKVNNNTILGILPCVRIVLYDKLVI